MTNSPLKKLPQHIAIVMDGNRRWAEKNNSSMITGHKAGARNVKKTTEVCAKLGIKHLTLFAFSSENWKRPKSWIDELMGLLKYYLENELYDLHKNGVRLRIIGQKEGFSKEIQTLLSKAEDLTKDNQSINLYLALNYGGRDDIVQMVQKICKKVQNGELEIQDINKEKIEENLCTAGIPDPDLLIRTSGEKRISNFLLWQLAYTEMIFIDKLWPDFMPQDLTAAISEYQNRERRFGALNCDQG